MTVMVAILAAGLASRFGGGKLDIACADKPLGRWVLDAVGQAGAPPGLLIVGPQPPAFAREALHDGWTLVTNAAPEEGIGGSIALAVAHAECRDADALLLLLADMPLISAKMVGALLSYSPLTLPVATRYPSGRPGVPARLPSSLFAALRRLEGDKGAAGLLGGREDLHLLDATADDLVDVDDAESLARAETLLRRLD